MTHGLLTNKMAGYHRHILHLPIFVKKASEKMKTFFFSKKHFIIFSNFSNFQNFLIFCQKTSSVGWERHFYEIIPFDTHSTANLPPLSILKKIQVFFQKNPSIFPEKNPNFERFENSYYSSRILRQICYNLVKK